MAAPLDAAVVAAVGDLELAARLIVEGLRSGAHRSPFHGFGHEFSQYRAYRPGDDLKYLDWKMLGRTDRLYTRQFREATNLSLTLVVDASASMGFPDGDLPKLKYGAIVAAALAYMVTTAGDAVALLAGGRDLVHLPARGGRAHLSRVLQRLARLSAAGTWDGPRMIALAAERQRRRGLIVVLSDFYDEEDETFRALKRAGAVGHEVVALQVVSREELDLPYAGAVAFDDLETRDRRQVDVEAVAGAYRASLAAFNERWRARTRASGIDFVPLVTDVPPSLALRRYLVARQGAVLR